MLLLFQWYFFTVFTLYLIYLSRKRIPISFIYEWKSEASAGKRDIAKTLFMISYITLPPNVINTKLSQTRVSND